MIKKIIFFLVFSVVSLAQQIELKSIEKTMSVDGQITLLHYHKTMMKKIKN